jgi:putative chitinase
MEITKEQLRAIMPNAGVRADVFLPYLNRYMERYGISNRMRVCHFLSQIVHESGELRYTRELASGKEYDTGKKARMLGNTPEADGDGQRYKGRGLIQITGRSNYAAISKATGVDFYNHPEWLELPQWATLSACWFWKSRGLNELADKDELTNITKKINGGMNGLQDRLKYLARAKKVIR